ncbi:MAG: antibiotic biosynthesis monooxygenase family protein [Chloroflexota bacterium]
MIIVIVNHFVKPGRNDAAVQRINTNGDRMATLPGFLFRYLLVSDKDPQKISTVTGWEAAGDYDNWNVVKRADEKGPMSPEESPYERVVNELHTVAQHDLAKLPA